MAINKEIELNGQKFYFNITDAKFMKKLRDSEQSFFKKITNIDSDDDIELLGLQFKAGCEFVDKVLGKGASKEIFGENEDVSSVMETYEAMLDRAESQSSEFAAYSDSLGNRMATATETNESSD